jgi:hypothetical protein
MCGFWFSAIVGDDACYDCRGGGGMKRPIEQRIDEIEDGRVEGGSVT